MELLRASISEGRGAEPVGSQHQAKVRQVPFACRLEMLSLEGRALQGELGLALPYPQGLRDRRRQALAGSAEAGQGEMVSN